MHGMEPTNSNPQCPCYLHHWTLGHVPLYSSPPPCSSLLSSEPAFGAFRLQEPHTLRGPPVIQTTKYWWSHRYVPGGPWIMLPPPELGICALQKRTRASRVRYDDFHFSYQKFFTCKIMARGEDASQQALYMCICGR
jgi:hypothetical protein